MIKTEGITKKFGDLVALDNINCTIPSGCVYGLVGSNGAGKSTFLRVLSGVYKADSGTLLLDDEPIYDNPIAKENIVFVSDDMYFLSGANLKRMASLYSAMYKDFDKEKFFRFTGELGLDSRKNLNSFSKGMKRQVAVLLAICSNTEYMFFDETFDGLDPIMRNFVRKIILSEILDRGTTAIITSHSLRELENVCDKLAVLHRGGLLFEDDVDNLKTKLFKVQIAFDYDYDESLFHGLDILNFEKKGSVSNFIVRGEREKAEKILKEKEPILFDILHLSLEEVFTYEMSALGYAFDDILEVYDNEENEAV